MSSHKKSMKIAIILHKRHLYGRVGPGIAAATRISTLLLGYADSLSTEHVNAWAEHHATPSQAPSARAMSVL